MGLGRIRQWRFDRPDSIAVRCGEDGLTYAQLGDRIDLLAAELADLGLGPGDIVAIALPLGIDAVVSALAVLHVGAAFLPLDLDAPMARNEAILSDAGVAALIRDPAAQHELSGGRGCRLVEPFPAPGAEPFEPDLYAASDLAYVIYTSGSSGTPKGVMATRGNLEFYLRHALDRYPSDGHGSVLHSPLAFDLSITSLFLPILRGETVSVVPAGPGVEELAAELQRSERVGLLKLTPSHLRLLDAALPDGALSGRVTTLIVGGEALFQQDLRRWRRESPGTRIFNEYGPTEATVGVLVHEVTGDEADGAVPIGVPFSGAETRLLNPREDGTAELLILGPGVTRGYLGQPYADPFGVLPDRADSYRTGDLVAAVPGGLVYKGRVDDQVKIAGHRIELGEIEHVLRAHPAVRDAAVVLTPAGDAGSRLLAYLVADGEAAPEQQLRNFVASRLPRTMIPASFEYRAELPRTLNGKTDKTALSGAAVTGSAVSAGPDASSTSLAIVGIDCVVPGADSLDAFWELLRSGGDGLTRLTDEQLLGAGVSRKEFEGPDYVRVSGVIDDIDQFDAAFFGISAAEAQYMDPQHRLLMHSVWQALEHAGRCGSTDRRRTGLFAGVSANTYLYTQVIPHWDAIGTAGTELQLLMGAEKDFAPARIAYELDLRGPAVAVQTGCSTGLVAVHMAGRALLTGECDTAVAATACIRVPHHAGAHYREGSIVSRTGQCNAFDADADGSVQGNGVVSVVLRRFEDAVRDGDAIYAVIAGSAVNNDGHRKVGFAAPSVEGQRDVIRTAHLAAGVRPDEVGYVEAHGTATSLGDPIEAEALRQAFGNGARCSIGSVKTNIGHLDVAAGLAGLVKTALALHHGQLPPSRNFRQLNPAISWPQGTFTVQHELAPWPPGRPRVAGVSAFSVGGTNAHVVLRGAPVADTVMTVGETHCVVLSAKRPEDLQAMPRLLADHLEARPDTDLGDIAYTLQYGRAVWPHRRAVLADSVPELCRQLRGEPAAPDHPDAAAWLAGADVDWSGWHSGRRRSRIPLPGTVWQMARYWVPVPGSSTRDTTVPLASPAANESHGPLYAPQWELEPHSAKPRPVRGWLLFAAPTELSNALLERLGDGRSPCYVVRPGDRFAQTGEREWTVGGDPADYVGLMEAVGATGKRPDRILHAWQTGAPTADPLDPVAFDAGIERGLTSLLHLGRALALGDTADEVNVAVITEHQFGFAAAGPVDPARAASLGAALVFPQEISGVTVALHDVAGLTAAAAAERLELASLAGRAGVFAHRGRRSYRRVLAPLHQPSTGRLDVRGQNWLITGGFGGVGFELAKDLADGGADLVLVNRPAGGGNAESAPASAIEVAPESEWLAAELTERTRAARVPLIHDDPELVERLTRMSAASAAEYLRRAGIDTGSGVTMTTSEILRQARVQPKFERMLAFLLGCLESSDLARRDGDAWTFTGRAVESAHDARRDVVDWAPDLHELMQFVGSCVDALPAVLSGEQEAIGVLYSHGSDAKMEAAARITMRRSLGSVQADLLAEWISRLAQRRRGSRPLRLLEFGAGNGLLTKKVVEALASRRVPVEYWITDIGHTFAAKARRLYGDRLPGVRTAALDISRDPFQQGIAEGEFDLLFGLNVVHATTDVRASFAQLRKLLAPGGLIALLESVKFEPWVDLVAGLAEGWWYFDDVYRTSSPLLGAEQWRRAMADAGLCETFALPAAGIELDRADCAIIVGREPDARSTAAAASQTSSASTVKQAKLRQLEQLGAKVTVVEADLNDQAAMRDALEQARTQFGVVHGVAHCAAEVRGGMVMHLDDASVSAELGAKARGLLGLLAALRDDPLRTVVLSSSLNVHFGGEGQAAYVGANAALAAVAEALDGQDTRVVAIDWDRWEGVGLAAAFQESFAAVRGREIGGGMTIERGLDAFHAAIGSGLPQVAVCVDDFHAKYAGHLAALLGSASAVAEPPSAGTARGAESALCAALVAICRELLGEDRFEAGHRLVDAGADSIFVLQLQAEIEERLGVRIFTAALLGQTVEQLARACLAPADNTGTVLVLDGDLLAKASAGGTS